jgi:hypothetical protein
MCLCIVVGATLWLQRQKSAPAMSARANPPLRPDVQPADKAVSSGDLSALEHRRTLLASRVKALDVRFKHLEQQQRNSGVGLPADLVASHRRLASFMEAATAALRDRDAAAAHAALDNAGLELDRLEKRLGR